MDTLLKLVETVPGATRWVQGEREVDAMKILTDREFIARLSTGERSRLYLWAQLYSGDTPDVLRDENWNLHRALNHLDQEGQVCFVRTLMRVWGIPR